MRIYSLLICLALIISSQATASRSSSGHSNGSRSHSPNSHGDRGHSPNSHGDRSHSHDSHGSRSHSGRVLSSLRPSSSSSSSHQSTSTPQKSHTPAQHTPSKPAPVHHTPTQHTPVKPAPVQTPVKPAPVQTPVKPAPVQQTPSPSTNGGLSAAQIQKIMPQASSSHIAQYAPYLNQAMKDAGINTPARQNAFIAQLAHESGQFRYMQELASGKAYEGRKDLGNTHPGDGEKYKGRGPIQITGRDNYEAAGKALGIDLLNHPELAATPEVGFKTAVWFWNHNNLNNLADKNTADSFSKITKTVNGCANCKSTHAEERNNFWHIANQVNN